jgi:acetolactate decarboxylase
MITEFSFRPIGINPMTLRFFLYAVAFPILFLSTVGCSPTPPSPKVETAASALQQVDVQHYGLMREVMRMGKTEARILLSDAIEKPHAFAVGALENLEGEIMVIDGDVWTARPDQDSGQILAGPNLTEGEAATLLTLAHVEHWQATILDSSSSIPQLEKQIASYASSQGIDTNQPFPVMIKGDASQLDLHVVNGYCPVAIDPATREAKPWRCATNEAKVTLVGFYARDSAGVLTHHTSCLHLHALAEIDGRTLMGHIDAVTLQPGAELFVPHFQ